jgi:hypothetical protein
MHNCRNVSNQPANTWKAAKKLIGVAIRRKQA